MLGKSGRASFWKDARPTMQHLSMFTVPAPLEFISFFVTLWLCVCALMAHLSGWRALATRFPANGDVNGEQFRFSSGTVGSSGGFPVGFRNCLRVTVSDSGLGLSLAFLFRAFGPSMLIPWEQVESVEDDRVWLVRCAMVRIRETPTRIGLQGKPGQSVLAAYARFQQRRGLRHT